MTDMTPYRKLAANIGCGDSDIMPKIFAMIANQDEAKLMLAASPPATVEAIAEQSGLPLDHIEEMIDPLFLRGLIRFRLDPADEALSAHPGVGLAPQIFGGIGPGSEIGSVCGEVLVMAPELS